MPYHLRATLLPYGDAPTDIWIADGKLTFAPQREAEELAPAGGYLLPGLVDCHVHLTMDFGGLGLPPGSREIVEEGRRRLLASGTLLVRDMGILTTQALSYLAGDDLPRVHSAGRFLAPEGGYFGIQQSTLGAELVEAAMDHVRFGVRWVKIIADWPGETMNFGRSEPNYPIDVVAAAVKAVHEAGARVAVHAMSNAGIALGITAGVDSIEHGSFIDDEQLTEMAARGIAWTPTLVIEEYVMEMVRDGGSREALARVRESYERIGPLIQTAHKMGIRILTGTDMLPPGSVAMEVAALQKKGLNPVAALAAASTAAREFLGEPGLDEDAPADLVLYESDPRNHPELLSHSALVMLNGRRVKL